MASSGSSPVSYFSSSCVDPGDRKALGREEKEPSRFPLYSVRSLQWSALSDKGRISYVWQEQLVADTDSMRIFPNNLVLLV